MNLLFALEKFGEQPAASSSQYTNDPNMRVKANCAWRLANKSPAVVWMRMKQVIITHRVTRSRACFVKTNRNERVVDEISTSLSYLCFRSYSKCVTLTVFFLCTILSSFFAMRSTSWSFTMFTGLGLFDGARWPCLHLCGKMRPSLCVSLLVALWEESAAFLSALECCIAMFESRASRSIRLNLFTESNEPVPVWAIH